MKKFVFTLQTVHNLRDQRCEQEELKLADLHETHNRTQRELREIEENRRRATELYADKMRRGALDSFEIALALDYLRALNQREQIARQTVATAKTRCQQQTRAVAEAMQAVEATTRLRDKQRQRFELEAQRREQNEIDEMVTLRYARRDS